MLFSPLTKMMATLQYILDRRHWSTCSWENKSNTISGSYIHVSFKLYNTTFHPDQSHIVRMVSRKWCPSLTANAIRLFSLIPPYVDSTEYARTLETVKQILNQNSSSTVIVWIPMCQNAAQLNCGLQKVASHWVRATLTISTVGLRGSTIHMVNPAASLHAILQSTLPWLAKHLSHDCCYYSVTSSSS
jgi:hypothetical protein